MAGLFPGLEHSEFLAWAATVHSMADRAMFLIMAPGVTPAVMRLEADIMEVATETPSDTARAPANERSPILGRPRSSDDFKAIIRPRSGRMTGAKSCDMPTRHRSGLESLLLKIFGAAAPQWLLQVICDPQGQSETWC